MDVDEIRCKTGGDEIPFVVAVAADDEVYLLLLGISIEGFDTIIVVVDVGADEIIVELVAEVDAEKECRDGIPVV